VIFVPPGPGVWELESTHFARPLCHFAREAFRSGFMRGFTDGCTRYGLMIAGFDIELVNGFVYRRVVGFGAPRGAKGPPPKIVLQILTRVLPAMRRRLDTAERAFTHKIWRDDLRRWDEHDKPAAHATHRALLEVDPRSLDDQALLAHVRACRDHLESMFELHHRYTVPATAAMGDFISHVVAWTNKPYAEIVQALRGASPISRGWAADERASLIHELQSDQEMRDVLLSDRSSTEILEALADRSLHARAYLAAVRSRCLGYDVASNLVGELPEMIVGTIRAAVDELPRHDDTTERISSLRRAVPAEHHAQFDELLSEARTMDRLRDERGHHSDGIASGICRRALLEVGARLGANGKLRAAAHAVDLEVDEIATLLRGGSTPSVREVEDRMVFRTTTAASDEAVPETLGGTPAPPPPAEWLPERGRRAHRTLIAVVNAIYREPELRRTTTSVRGLPASPGVYEGVARRIDADSDFAQLRKGDVLVTEATSPYFNVVLPMLGAIVTDRGGQLCHAAIVSREYGIPAVVGTREATQLVRDGARVRVDGDRGVVEVLG
jgi:rifampicin phosphotransferase